MAQSELTTQFPTVFHYTSLAALKSILLTQELWATHFRHLNDSTEFVLSRKHVQEVLRTSMSAAGLSRFDNDPDFRTFAGSAENVQTQVLKDAEKWARLIYEHTYGSRGFRDVFICSFCSHENNRYAMQNGLLSQWRGYGAGGGVALEFCTHDLEQLLGAEWNIYRHPICHIGDVTYDIDGTEDEIKSFDKSRSILKIFSKTIILAKIITKMRNISKIYFQSTFYPQHFLSTKVLRRNMKFGSWWRHLKIHRSLYFPRRTCETSSAVRGELSDTGPKVIVTSPTFACLAKSRCLYGA